MVDICYFSLTGNTESFIEDLEDEVESDIYDINKYQTVHRPFVLITPTYHFGDVHEDVLDFLERNSEHLVGVIASGNFNWGEQFANAGNVISERYDVPFLYKFELNGEESDVMEVKRIMEELQQC